MAPYTLPDLAYDPASLEPHLSARIIELHHDKHHQGYVDGDGDSYGNGNALCDDNADLVVDGGDCDDTDVDVNPGATEICGNLIDDDCQAGDADCAVEPAPIMEEPAMSKF